MEKNESSSIRDFKQLLIWQQGVEIACMVYKATSEFPKHERYSLADQMQRAAVSIGSNIAEGQERGSTLEFIRFLRIARASTGELETQLIIAQRLNYVNGNTLDEILARAQAEKRMINGLITKLKNKQW